MDVYEAIFKRKSIRSYETKTVPTQTLLKILEAGRSAPSAGNRQPWHFIVVTDEEKRKELSKGMFAKLIAEAPIVIVACGDAKTSAKWYPVDVSLAVENMVLAATAEDLGTCCVGSFDEQSVKKVLGIPENLRAVMMLAIGYPKEKESLRSRATRLATSQRKGLEDIVSFEEYGNRQGK